jgi:sec-independent protein translocase protein TatB
MFDINLSELMVIGVVALVVIGPERLPKVARTAGLLLGRLQRYVGDVKADINREMQLDELKKLQQEVKDKVMSMEASVTQEMREVESSVGSAIAPPAIDDAAAAATPAPEAVAVTDTAAAPAAERDDSVAEVQKT